MLISEDQIQELYEINDDPKRKEFLDDLFSFMQKRGTPINRLPIMAKSVLDLYELYNLVIARGGLVDVINKKLWQEIIKGLHLPSSITSAAFTLRTQYMKYLYPYECDKKNLSTPSELQAAIDGNRREGRRSSYGQYEAMHSQMQMPQIGRQSLPQGIQQMSPLALVTHAANNQQAQAAAAAAAAHHRLMAPTFGQMPNLVTHEFEQRMMEYLKLIQVKKEQQSSVAAVAVAAAAAAGGNAAGVGVGEAAAAAMAAGRVGAGAASAGVGGGGGGSAGHIKPQRQRSQSPEMSTREAMNALEMSRVAFWQMYHNNTSPPASMNASPQGSALGAASIGGGGVSGGVALGVAGLSEQHSEALNLSDSPPNLTNIKREREREQTPDACDRDDFQHQPPPAKRGVGGASALSFPTSFYLPPGMAAAAAAAAANFHQHNSNNLPQDSDGEDNDEDGSDAHNMTGNSLTHAGGGGDGDGGDGDGDENDRSASMNGHHHHHPQHHRHQHLPHNLHLPHHQHLGNSSSGNHDKSDDSAIENSPSTSAASAGGGGGGSGDGGAGSGNGIVGVSSGHISPISTKKIHLSKQHNNNNNNGATSAMDCSGSGTGGQSRSPGLGGVEDALNLLSGMQFRVMRNGTSANGEPQLVVNLELNGIKYSGLLIANTTGNSSSNISPADLSQNKTELLDSNNITDTTEEAKDVSGGGISGADADIEDEDIADAASTTSTEETPTKVMKSGGAAVGANSNGPLSDGGVLQDALMTTS
ncbi:PREDICTED: protein dead ringer isoform X1 [Rhagoletis zephyria]|uniref:protein dead ringer isoform X1 n=1 Tax=Rhagoletis zephyria TaxID=28612 RepID=UPI0008112454|nr:PREDICTED: protein dead ringer isoform X1 [Rhagoletis zephyria]